MSQSWLEYDPSAGVHENLGTRIQGSLAALRSCFSGATAPTATVAYMLWADTANGVLKMRNATNTAWLEILALGAPAHRQVLRIPLPDLLAEGDPIIFSAPSSARIIGVDLVAAADCLADLDNYWTFQLQNVTKTENLLAAAVTSAETDILAYTPFPILADQNREIDTGDVVLLSIGGVGTPGTVTSPAAFLTWELTG
jgi:hypothetical protein